MKLLFNLLLEYWPVIAPLLYEFLARVWPTKWNISILDNIWKLLNMFIPNNRLPDGKENVVLESLEPNGRTSMKNLIKVKIGRHILRCLLVLFLFSVTLSLSPTRAYSQIWQNFKGVRLVNVLDSTTVLPVNGTIWYNEQKAFPRFQVWENDTLKELLTGIGGGAFWPLGGSATLNSAVNIHGSDLINIGGVSDGTSKFQIQGATAGFDRVLSLYNTSGVIVHGFSENGSAVIGPFTFSASGNSISNTNDTQIIANGSTFNLISTGFLIDALQYNNTTNSVLLTNPALTHATSIFGGEIQIDKISPSQDLTINNAGVSSTGTPFDILVTGGDLTIENSTSDIIINPASDVRLTPGGQLFLSVGAAPIDNTSLVLAQNQSTGAIVTRDDIFAPGNYATTLSDGVNITSATEALNATYIRSGVYVTVTIFFSPVTLTAPATLTTFDLDLPIPSNFAIAANAFGHIYTSDAAIGTIVADPTDDTVAVSFTCVGTSASWHLTFTYEII